MELGQILEQIEVWQAEYDYGQPPTAARLEEALKGEAVTLRTTTLRSMPRISDSHIAPP